MSSHTLGDGLEAFFERTGYSEADYSQPWVALELGPVKVRIPNTAARQAVVGLHDAHHVITEYDTGLRGEAEIGAWEIASGCGSNLSVWGLNLLAMSVGVVLAPRRTFRAFMRGRSSDNLYASGERPLEESLTSLRRKLGVDGVSRSGRSWGQRVADVGRYVGAAVLSLVIGAFAAVATPAMMLVGEVGWRRYLSQRDAAVAAAD